MEDKKNATIKSQTGGKHVEKLSQTTEVPNVNKMECCLRKAKHFCPLKQCKRSIKGCSVTDSEEIAKIAENVRQEVKNLQNEALKLQNFAKELDKEAKKRK